MEGFSHVFFVSTTKQSINRRSRGEVVGTKLILMKKECYYFNHKVDQDLCAYVEIGATWEDSFIMEFRTTEDAPHFIKTGALYENRSVLLAFKMIALMEMTEILRDKKLEWKPIQKDPQLEYTVKTFRQYFFKTNNKKD